MPVRDELGRRLTYTASDLTGCRQDKEAPAADLAPSGVTARWGYAGFGTAIGLSNIVLDGGEIYLGGSTIMYGPDDYWYALRYARATRSYQQVFVSRRLPGLIALGLADVRGDQGLEIVAAQENGAVVLFDQRSRAEVATLTVAATGVAGMALRDLNGDGKAEILLTTWAAYGNTLYVLAGDGTLLWQQVGAGGYDVTVGNMDADPSLEIATTSGAVVDWDTRSIQWQRPQGFGIDVETGDIDADGKQELIAAQAWDFIWAFDVDTQLPKWSLPMFNTGTIWLGNVDGDAQLELLVGEAQWGEVLAFDALTLAQEWSIPNPEHGVTSIAIGDPDGNGTRDVLWGAGATSSGSDRLYVANLATRTIDWQNEQLDGPFLPPQRGDVDGDGLAEIVTASSSSESGYDAGRIVVLDGLTLQVRGISPPVVNNLAWTGVHDLRLRNVDADSELEIVIAADDTYDGVIEVYDFAGDTGMFTRIWTNVVQPQGAPFHTVEVADVDADGALEVVGGVGKEHTGSQGTFVYVYSYPGGGEEWHTFTLTTSWAPISGLAVLAQGGGVADIVAMVDGETLNFFDGTGQVQAIVPGVFRFVGPDASSSGRAFLAGTGVGEVRQYQRQGNAYAVTWSRALAGPAVEGVSMLSGGAMAEAAGGRLYLYPQRDAPLAWQSQDYGVRGTVMVGTGASYRPFVGGSYALVSLAPWTTLVDVQPRSGPFYGGTPLTVSGTSFDPAAQLYVGARPAIGTQVLGPTVATGATPTLRPCSLNSVTVVNPDMSFEILEDAFRARRFAPTGCGPRELGPTAESTEAQQF